jgi:hypothetical protein
LPRRTYRAALFAASRAAEPPHKRQEKIDDRWDYGETRIIAAGEVPSKNIEPSLRTFSLFFAEVLYQ